MNRATRAILLLAATGCAKGAAPEPIEFESGVYELLTVDVEGDCAPEDVITPGAERIGKMARVSIDVNDRRMQLEVCNDFFDNACMPQASVDPLGFLRDEVTFLLEESPWEVPGCPCPAWTGSRDAKGTIVADGSASFTWHFEIPPAPEWCGCGLAVVCNATVKQRLDVIDP